MEHSEFVKGVCGHCGGHLEFPRSAAGQIIPCPHCGQPTTLAQTGTPRRRPRHIRLALVAGGLILAAGLAGAFLARRAVPTTVPAPPSVEVSAIPSNPPPAIAKPAPEVPKEPQPVATTNDFAIMPFHLQKTPGSSLVYVTGIVRNQTPRQRFGVKVEFELFDTNDNPVGSASDYQSVIDPHGAWHFQALVMASHAAVARFDSITEQ